MTQEERVAACEEKCVRFVGYGFNATQRELVAEAIREAVAAERERCLGLLDALEACQLEFAGPAYTHHTDADRQAFRHAAAMLKLARDRVTRGGGA